MFGLVLSELLHYLKIKVIFILTSCNIRHIITRFLEKESVAF